MFTGIIEELGEIVKLTRHGENMDITVKAAMTPELKIDQSVAHNGVCLTVVAKEDSQYTVTAIKETLNKTNLKDLKPGQIINLERGMQLGARLDGHIVQGHVDQTAICENIRKLEGSTYYTFSYDLSLENITIEKGSITINGVSLTVVNSKKEEFGVAIIPYTYEHTTFKDIKEGDTVNLEFDVIGKYVRKLTQL